MSYQEILDIENEIHNEPEYLKNLMHDPKQEQFDNHVDKGVSLGYSLENTIAAILYEDECGCR